MSVMLIAMSNELFHLVSGWGVWGGGAAPPPTPRWGGGGGAASPRHTPPDGEGEGRKSPTLPPERLR
jgi:hypothetical protein